MGSSGSQALRANLKNIIETKEIDINPDRSGKSKVQINTKQ